jgi:hypothetical protein
MPLEVPFSKANIIEKGVVDYQLYSASRKTTIFSVFDKKALHTRLSKFSKPRSLQVVNDCFKNKSNAVVGVFL